ncbi:MAG: galactose oxidase-like domain-containing protein, partial [Saprospiraceae bacterium]
MNLFIRFLIIGGVFFCTLFSLKAQNESTEGSWGSPISFDIVPVAVANLPDGRLITWSSQFPGTFIEIGDGMTYTELFDPSGNGGLGQALGSTVTATDHDMFCPGINNLADGRILSAGGTTSERTSIYDPVTNVWTRAADMNIPRGYQGNVTLSNGAVFTIGGSWSGGAADNGGKDAELWTPESGWINLSNVTGDDIFNTNDLNLESQTNPLYRVDNHVWLWPAPNGKLFHAGPGEMMHWIDTDISGGAIEDAGLRSTDTYSMKGNTVMFDIGKILKVGGSTSYGEDFAGTTPAKDNSFVIDLNGVTHNGTNYIGSPTVISAGNLEFARTMLNSTVLPNGQVLVTGGLDRAAVFSDTGSVLPAELYTPSTSGGSGTWQTVASMVTPRTYHSVAILMTDGRVFVGGGGLCDNLLNGCENHFDAEIYSPPYLFDGAGSLAARPTISTAPDISDYNNTISVTGSNSISEFSLIRFSAATHSTNNEQRRIPVSHTGTSGSYSVNIPNRELLPPGYYMLFALDTNGVPSEAHTIRIGSALPLQLPNENLIVDLEFEETTGTLANDSSSYNNDATIVERDNNGNVITTASNFTWTPDGIFGRAIEFDGLEHQSNALMEMSHSPSMASLDEEITVMAWAYRNSSGSTIPDTGRVANVGLFSHDYVSTLFFGFHNTMYKWAFVTDNGPVDLYGGYAPMDTWVHLAATYDGENAKLYANGELIAWKELEGTIPFRNDGSLESRFTTSGFYDDRTPAQLPSYANNSGITDEINGRIDELKVYNKVLGESEIRTAFLEGQQTGNPDIVNCSSTNIEAQYKVGAAGNWQNANTLTVQEGAVIFIRAVTPGNQYFVTTPQENGPTFNSNGSPAYEYQIDTSVFQGSNPERNNGIVDVSNQGQFILTTPGGCAAVFDLIVEIIDETDGCPNQLLNEDPNIVLEKGDSSGLEVTKGTPFITNGSPCALELSNLDIDEPFRRHNITLDLMDLGIAAGNEIYISIDAEGTNGIAKIEVVEDNTPNTALLENIFGSGWSTFDGTFTVPTGIDDINIWLFTNWNSNSPGTIIYDNLTVINLSTTGGNIPPNAIASATPTSGTAPLIVDFTGSTSTDDNAVVSYAWDFGDGNSANTADPQHTYTTTGSFTATLTVEDAQGLTDSIDLIINVNDSTSEPCPDFLSNDDISIILPLGDLVGGVDTVTGGSSYSNGSSCGISVENLDTGQRWGRYRLPIVLSDYGILPGEELLIGVDGRDFSGSS